MADRWDQFAECNTDKAPIDVFTAACCSRCLNPECTRSLAGASKFDQRVSTWYERLYGNVPRMSTEDPRYAKISGQKFLMIDGGRVPSISTSSSAWLDPRDLERPPEAPKLALPVIPPKRPDPPPTASAPPEAAQALPTPETHQKYSPRNLMLANAPVQPGQMIQSATGTPAPPAQAPKDPWAAPPSTTTASPGVKVVKPGATVKLGGSGV